MEGSNTISSVVTAKGKESNKRQPREREKVMVLGRESRDELMGRERGERGFEKGKREVRMEIRERRKVFFNFFFKYIYKYNCFVKNGCA